MSLLESLGLGLMHRVDPERAHGLALKALTSGLAPLPGPVTSPRLACTLAGMPHRRPKTGAIAAISDARTGVVAAWARYTG